MRHIGLVCPGSSFASSQDTRASRQPTRQQVAVNAGICARFHAHRHAISSPGLLRCTRLDLYRARVCGKYSLLVDATDFVLTRAEQENGFGWTVRIGDQESRS